MSSQVNRHLLALSFRRITTAAAFLWVATWFSYLFLDNPAESLIHNVGRGDFTAATGRLGGWEFLLPFVVVFGAFLLFIRRNFFATVLVVIPYVAAAITTSILKTSLARPEPNDMAGELGRSFPSGHTAQASAVYLSIAVLAYVFQYSRSRLLTAVGIAGCVTPGIALYLRNAHWLSDFFGGYAIGLTAIAMSCGIWLLWLRITLDASPKPAQDPRQ